MRLSGRLAAAIEVLTDFERRRVPLKTALADWARGARFAGAKDRAFVSGLCLDALRRRRSLGAAMGDASPRAALLGALRWLWARPLEELAEAAAEAPHGPGALTPSEIDMLQASGFGAGELGPRAAMRSPSPPFPLPIEGDFPDWLLPHVSRVFGASAAQEMQALAARADVDLRINTLKTTPAKAIEALAVVGAAPTGLIVTAARIKAPAPSEKTTDVTIIPAFNKGWVEVQDLGSQIAAASAGEVKGAQVLDYCAGGGGKTLALAAMMENTGQLYAYDSDARRLKPLYERARRAGVRNLQILNPLTDDAALLALRGKIDVVFLDAPCTGSGVWRRHPDSKWRLTPEQLERRMAEQDEVLSAAAHFVKSGGRIVYVTCSIFMEENEDRLAAFLRAHPAFAQTDVMADFSGVRQIIDASALRPLRTSEGALRLTPLRLGCDGFFISSLRKAA